MLIKPGISSKNYAFLRSHLNPHEYPAPLGFIFQLVQLLRFPPLTPCMQSQSPPALVSSREDAITAYKAVVREEGDISL